MRYSPPRIVTPAAEPTEIEGSVVVTDGGGSLTVDGPVTDAQLRASAVPVSGPLTDAQLRATAVPVSGPLTDAQIRASALVVRDDYTSQESLADQSGANDVLTFTFSAEVQLVVVVSRGTDLVCRATANASETPSATLGVPCFDQAAVFLPVRTSSVKVYAPTGTTVSVVGLKR